MLDRPLPAGELGEVCVRGRNVMVGYYRNPEETARTVRAGWLHTGDMGRLDEDGFLFIVERKKDLIIRGGFNIYPREVEEVLYAHPKVAEAAVVGMKDPLMGEDVLAFVVLRSGERGVRGGDRRVLRGPARPLQVPEADPLRGLAAQEPDRQDPAQRAPHTDVRRRPWPT